MKICPCGGSCREHEVIGPPAGWVVTCNACGRRELFPRQSRSDCLEMPGPDGKIQHKAGCSAEWVPEVLV